MVYGARRTVSRTVGRTDGRKTLQIEVCSLPKNGHFLVFLAVWVIFPKFLGR